MKHIWIILGILLFATSASAQYFDHEHTAWNMLLKQHVRWISNGTASQVDYAGLKKDRTQLRDYLAGLSDISERGFESWGKDQQLAFLINAYNAFTIELILIRYPDLDSIKDLGNFLKSPWKKKFFTLLGKKRHLDWIEHEMIRKPGAYDDPRIHAAVVCASVGCPGIRNEAFIARKLNAQLDDSFRRFLSDRTRNRYNPREGTLEVSKIFDWYGGDFGKGHGGFASLEATFGKYADVLADHPADREKIRSGNAGIRFLEYDWKLNDLP
ncbi:DUF547 domain-containing protein [Desulfonema ishimotonii]|uniref:DUF547 domain-containing protein n=1 Tax=Desulfonema ishimotonii TaxID=45657 RepID=A0A401G458_9BACT|nr:DUF547 domain-containing protein [Desulfonema ishimotonii]GBC63973.1 DUF547 domain-containing protein [Desulfonema ishimotonii]